MQVKKQFLKNISKNNIFVFKTEKLSLLLAKIFGYGTSSD